MSKEHLGTMQIEFEGEEDREKPEPKVIEDLVNTFCSKSREHSAVPEEICAALCVMAAALICETDFSWEDVSDRILSSLEASRQINREPGNA